MDAKEFSIDEIAKKAQSIGTGFSVASSKAHGCIKRYMIGIDFGRSLIACSHAEQWARYLPLERRWMMWTNRPDGDLMTFDAPPPRQIEEILFAEWEACEIEKYASGSTAKRPASRL